MNETTPATRIEPEREPAAGGLVALRAYPRPGEGEMALALLGASGVRGLLLMRPDGSSVVAVHQRDEAAAERALLEENAAAAS